MAARMARTIGPVTATSANRSYRLDHIEKAVIDGLLARMRNPASISAYIESMQEERRNEAKTRAAAERAVQRAQSSIDNLSRALVHGRIDDGFFDREIVGLRRDLAEAQAKLNMASAANVVTLHPAAVAQMEQTISLLAKHLPDIDPDRARDMMAAFRGVMIHDRDDGRIDCEVIGRLTSLIASGSDDIFLGGSSGGEGEI